MAWSRKTLKRKTRGRRKTRRLRGGDEDTTYEAVKYRPLGESSKRISSNRNKSGTYNKLKRSPARQAIPSRNVGKLIDKFNNPPPELPPKRKKKNNKL
jgi:hypothetical protein